MTSYIPLLPTISARRGPCQERCTIVPRAKLPAPPDQRSQPSDCQFLGCPRRRDRPGASGQPCGPARPRARHPVGGRRADAHVGPASRPRPSPQPTSRTQRATHARAGRRNLHLAASLWTTTRRRPTRWPARARFRSQAASRLRLDGALAARPKQRSPMRGRGRSLVATQAESMSAAIWAADGSR
jgi:hypothetical protein